MKTNIAPIAAVTLAVLVLQVRRQRDEAARREECREQIPCGYYKINCDWNKLGMTTNET